MEDFSGQLAALKILLELLDGKVAISRPLPGADE